MSNTARNILQQVSTTSVSAGSLKGHIITDKQFAALLQCLSELEGDFEASPSSPAQFPTPHAFTNTDYDIAIEEAEIERLTQRLSEAAKIDRPSINEKIQACRSRIAHLRKLARTA